MVEVAASAAFWDVGRDAIDALLTNEYGIRVEDGLSFPARLALAIQTVLGCGTSQALTILERRCVDASVIDDVEEMLESAECQALMQKHEQEHCDKHIAEVARQRMAQTALKDFVKDSRIAAGGAARQRKAVKWPGEGPKAIDSDLLNRSMCPPDYYIRRDAFNGRWYVRQRSATWSCSKSWGSGSEASCTRLCLQAAWSRHMSLTGEKCPVTGLF